MGARLATLQEAAHPPPVALVVGLALGGRLARAVGKRLPAVESYGAARSDLVGRLGHAELAIDASFGRAKVIDAQAAADQRFLSEQRRADAEAYALEKHAEAQRGAAGAGATALRTRAEAEAEAEERRARGERARAMVPVEVERAKVDVERERVDNVVKPELEARELHGKVAQEFELAKLRVEAEREVRVAIAHASASLFTKVQANLYGTPEDVARIGDAFLKGQGAAATANGF